MALNNDLKSSIMEVINEYRDLMMWGVISKMPTVDVILNRIIEGCPEFNKGPTPIDGLEMDEIKLFIDEMLGKTNRI